MKPYYEEDGITIYHGDCREVLPTLPKVDLVLTDPPYGIGDKWAQGAQEGKRGKSRLWGKGEKWDDSTADEALAQCLRMDAEKIIWGGNYYALPPSRMFLIWDKVQKFSNADCEMAWCSFDGAARVFRMSRIDAYFNQAIFKKEHPTEKPIPLMVWCIEQPKEPAQTILDPFMGSGTTLVAAKQLGRRAIGIELEEKYCEIAVQRLRQGVLAL